MEVDSSSDEESDNGEVEGDNSKSSAAFGLVVGNISPSLVESLGEFLFL